MTWALCFSCGHTKFGAICPCPECGVSTTGNMDLDILFSDHVIAHKSLEDLGRAIKAINRVTENPALRLDSFLYYVSEKHHPLLRCELSPDAVAVVQDVLS